MPTPSITIRSVDRFAEPHFTNILNALLGEHERARVLKDLLGHEAASNAPARGERVRIGAFCADELVGWSEGWLIPGGALHVGSSAVLPDLRRQGIYTRLVTAIEQRASELGCKQVTSLHRAANAPVLIAKLRAGYVICGTEFSLEMGLLIKMAKQLIDTRHKVFDARLGPIEHALCLQPPHPTS